MFLSLFFSVVLCFILQLTTVNATTKSAGCGKKLASSLNTGGVGDSNDLNFTTSSNENRTYLLHIPTGYSSDTAAPLIFSFHGRGSTPDDQEQMTEFSSSTYNHDSIVVYPAGIDEEWQGDPAATGHDDISFTLELLGELENEFCIDTERVYANGHSNGGGFSLNILACNSTSSKKFAAFAANAGAYYQGTSDKDCDPLTVNITCSPGRSDIPILEIHGSSDDTIPYYGGTRRDRCLPTIPYFVQMWADQNGFSTTNDTTDMYNSKVHKAEFGSDENRKGLVTSYWIYGLGHTWANADDGSHISSTPTMLEFFGNHTLTLDSTTTTTSSVSSTSSGSSPSSTSTNTPDTYATTTSISCPKANNTVYANTNGKKYHILCNMDTTDAPLKAVAYPGSFAGCIRLCDVTLGCRSVSYTGACYLKGAPTKYIRKGSRFNRVAVRVSGHLHKHLHEHLHGHLHEHLHEHRRL